MATQAHFLGQALLLDGISHLDTLETMGHRVTLELLVALETLQHL